jgi:hypothetical protein
MDLLVSFDENILIVSQGVRGRLVAVPHCINALRELKEIRGKTKNKMDNKPHSNLFRCHLPTLAPLYSLTVDSLFQES